MFLIVKSNCARFIRMEFSDFSHHVDYQKMFLETKQKKSCDLQKVFNFVFLSIIRVVNIIQLAVSKK